MRITPLSGSSSTCSFVKVIISFVLISLILTYLFCLNPVRQNLSVHGSYQRGILQELEVNLAKLFGRKKKKGERRKKKQ